MAFCLVCGKQPSAKLKLSFLWSWAPVLCDSCKRSASAGYASITSWEMIVQWRPFSTASAKAVSRDRRCNELLRAHVRHATATKEVTQGKACQSQCWREMLLEDLQRESTRIPDTHILGQYPPPQFETYPNLIPARLSARPSDNHES